MFLLEKGAALEGLGGKGVDGPLSTVRAACLFADTVVPRDSLITALASQPQARLRQILVSLMRKSGAAALLRRGRVTHPLARMAGLVLRWTILRNAVLHGDAECVRPARALCAADDGVPLTRRLIGLLLAPAGRGVLPFMINPFLDPSRPHASVPERKAPEPPQLQAAPSAPFGELLPVAEDGALSPPEAGEPETDPAQAALSAYHAAWVGVRIAKAAHELGRSARVCTG